MDLPSLDILDRVVAQMKWIMRAREMVDCYLTLADVTELIGQGERCGIAMEHELMMRFALRRDKGLWWEGQVANLLKMEAVPFEALERLLDEAVDLSVHKDTYVRLESVINRTREASQHVASLMLRMQLTNILERPLLSEARKVVKAIDELPVKLRDTPNLKRLVQRSEDWLRRGKKLFGKTNASVTQLEEHLLLIQHHNDKVFAITDIPKSEGTSSPTPHSPGRSDAKDTEEGPYCICRSGPTGEMVECDKCKEWYLSCDTLLKQVPHEMSPHQQEKVRP